MARRIGAMLGMIIIVGLVCILMWRVYLHHRQSGDESDEPGVIAALANLPGGTPAALF
jgi:hypothetical protein